MTSSDAIMLAQLCASLLVASAVAHISSIKDGSPVTRLAKFTWYSSVATLSADIILCLLVAALASFVKLGATDAWMLYVLVAVGTIGTAASIWGQVQTAIMSRAR
ncbi:MAG: hypothetical protein JSS74_09100 [Actinobacteria bacterium]|nr:hypothetical protein [Actinomycetota bacterium]